MKIKFTKQYYSYGSDIVFNSLHKGIAKKLLHFAENNKEGEAIIINGITYSLEFNSINYKWRCISVYFRDETRNRLIRISDHWCHKPEDKTINRGFSRKGIAPVASATKIVNSHWEISGNDESFVVFTTFGCWDGGKLPNGEIRPKTSGKKFEGGWVCWDKIQLSPKLMADPAPYRGIRYTSRINQQYKLEHKSN